MMQHVHAHCGIEAGVPKWKLKRVEDHPSSGAGLRPPAIDHWRGVIARDYLKAVLEAARRDRGSVVAGAGADLEHGPGADRVERVA